MLNWSKRFNIFCFLDNNHYHFQEPEFECILAAGSINSVQLSGENPLSQLKAFHQANPSWLFGHFSYDLLHDQSLPVLASTDFGKGFFFQPEILIKLDSNSVSIQSMHPAAEIIFEEISLQPSAVSTKIRQEITLTAGIDKPAYLDIIKKLKDHIRRGDCYEINFCQYFTAEEVIADPQYLYQELVSISPNPFSVLYNNNGHYCICASPERYLKLDDGTLISQPIKGTSKRDPVHEIDDKNLKYLMTSPKERSENVMIVDLVRNDLSQVCERGTVKAEELFGVYAFPQVYQMISTITGRALPELHWTDYIRSTFPMGSMTGAPKKRVMELINQYEKVRRGLFSGTIGYIRPSGEFDFNVVIRSLFYKEDNKELSFYAGSGITFYSDPQKEYEECLMKAEAIMKVLGRD